MDFYGLLWTWTFMDFYGLLWTCTFVGFTDFFGLFVQYMELDYGHWSLHNLPTAGRLLVGGIWSMDQLFLHIIFNKL